MGPILGYWNIRGLGEQIRYMLHYTGTEFEDKRYTDYGIWIGDKFTLGMDFPNLPYYIDENVKLSQSTAILRYLGRKHGLVAKTEEELTRQDLVEHHIIDIRTTLMRISYNCIDFDKERKVFVQTLPTQFRLLSQFLGNNDWLVGEKLTYVDFMAYEILDFLQFLEPGCLDNCPVLTQYMRRFELLEPIHKYMNSSDHIKWPIFAPFAKFGGGERPSS